jgi:hypothetical protein
MSIGRDCCEEERENYEEKRIENHEKLKVGEGVTKLSLGHGSRKSSLGNREVPVQEHIDICFLSREIPASSKTALERVMEVYAS